MPVWGLTKPAEVPYGEPMPTPIGHALGGLIVGLVLRPPSPPATSVPPADLRPSQQPPSPAGTSVPAGNVPAGNGRGRDVSDLNVCAIVACLPDLDFLWGRHNMETHSLGFAVLAGAVVFACRQSPRLAIACALAVASHVLFDWLGSDDFPPLGVMALWPITSQFYFADAFVFDAISRRYWLDGFVLHNVVAVVREAAILGPIAVLAWWWRRNRVA